MKFFFLIFLTSLIFSCSHWNQATKGKWNKLSETLFERIKKVWVSEPFEKDSSLKTFTGYGLETFEGNLLVSGKDSLFLLNQHTGKKIWSKKVEGSLRAGISQKNGVLYFASDAFFYAMNLRTQKILWKKKIFFPAHTKPLVFQGKVFFAGSEVIYALDIRNGKKLWSYVRSINKKGQLILPTFHLILLKGRIYYGFPDGTLVSLNPKSGRAYWVKKLPSKKPFSQNLLLSSKSFQNMIFVGGYGDHLSALSARSGKILWTLSTPITAPASIIKGRLYYPLENQVVALDLPSKRKLWEFEFKKSLFHLDFKLYDEKFLISGKADGGIYLISPSSGQKIDTFRPGWGVASYIIRNKDIYMVSTAGKVYKLVF